MCNQNTLQQKIAELTNDGEDILRFLAETVRGETPGVKAHHRLEASRQLTRLNNLGNHAPTPNRHSRENGNPVGHGKGGINTPSPSKGEGQDGGENPTHPINPAENSQLRTQH